MVTLEFKTRVLSLYLLARLPFSAVGLVAALVRCFSHPHAVEQCNARARLALRCDAEVRDSPLSSILLSGRWHPRSCLGAVLLPTLCGRAALCWSLARTEWSWRLASSPSGSWPCSRFREMRPLPSCCGGVILIPAFVRCRSYLCPFSSAVLGLSSH